MAQTKPTPFRFSPELDSKMEALAAQLKKSKQETMRICMELGAKWLETNGYDPGREIKTVSVIDTLQEVVTNLSNALEQQLRARDKALEILKPTQEK